MGGAVPVHDLPGPIIEQGMPDRRGIVDIMIGSPEAGSDQCSNLRIIIHHKNRRHGHPLRFGSQAFRPY